MLLNWVLFFFVFFRGFRGRNICHYQIETARGGIYRRGR
jgi:hypothetical protein